VAATVPYYSGTTATSGVITKRLTYFGTLAFSTNDIYLDELTFLDDISISSGSSSPVGLIICA
jgi:hypothetical protein